MPPLAQRKAEKTAKDGPSLPKAAASGDYGVQSNSFPSKSGLLKVESMSTNAATVDFPGTAVTFRLVAGHTCDDTAHLLAPGTTCRGKDCSCHQVVRNSPYGRIVLFGPLFL